MLKVCFKTIANATNARITKKQGLQRKNERMNKDLLKLASIWRNRNSKSLQGAEAARRYSSDEGLFQDNDNSKNARITKEDYN